jgi:hypothetical protein
VKKKTKRKAKPSKPKMTMVTCETCGMKYAAGAPHSAFCRGFRGDGKCEDCGKVHEGAFKCKECGGIFCPECGNDLDRLCQECQDNLEADGSEDGE